MSPRQQALHRAVARVRYRLVDHRRERTGSTIEVDGRAFAVAPGVFNPAVHISGVAIASAIDDRWIPAGAAVLDLACGSGVIAVFAAAFGAHVTATDVSPEAVTCARANVARHGLSDRVEVHQADLLTDLGRFDVIICNPPYEIGRPPTADDQTLVSPDFFTRLAPTVVDHLTTDGRMLLALPEGHNEPVGIFRRQGLTCEVFQTIPTRVANLTMWQVRLAG